MPIFELKTKIIINIDLEESLSRWAIWENRTGIIVIDTSFSLPKVDTTSFHQASGN
jgi:hypothetical protein